MARISAVIIALNEEKNIGGCLEAVAFCDEKIVVDSGSADRTIAIAEVHGAKVFSNAFVDFASQKNVGIGKARGDWVLLIDADERVSEALALTIKKTLMNPTFDGYYLTRLNRIFGRWMRHGDNANDLQLRLVKKEKALFEGAVHERIYLQEKTGILKGPLLHYSTENISSYMKKLNQYTGLEATTWGHVNHLTCPHVVEGRCSPVKMLLKPIGLFFYRLIWQRGFLDGMEGFFFCALSAYYQFLCQAKKWEIQTEVTK